MSDEVLSRAYAFLRSHTCGDLRFDEHLRPVKFVFLPDGRLASSVMVAMLQAVDTVLFIPKWEEGAMEIMVTLEEFDENSKDGNTADRWRIYHGDPQDVRWAFLTLDSARYDGMVVDGEALVRENALADVESTVCQQINGNHKDKLRTLCARHAAFEVEEPVLVGVDPWGFDVRARFDVVRVQTDPEMNTIEEAMEMFRAMSQ